MNKLASMAAILATVAFLGASALAQATRPEPKPVLVAQVDEMKTVLKLTDEQVKKMTDLIDVTEKDKKAQATDFESVKAEYDKAVAAGDDAATKAAIEKWTAIWKKQGDINTKGTADIESALTGEQLAQWREHKYLDPVMVKYKKLSLTDDQMSKVRSEFKKLFAEAKPDEKQPWMFQYLLMGKIDKVVQKEVLTEEQRVQMLMDFVTGQYKSMKLSDEQMAKIKEQATTLVKGASDEDQPFAMVQKLGAYVQKEVFTPEQKQQALVEPALAWFKKMDLTDDQVAKIKEQADTILKDAKPEDQAWTMSVKLGTYIQKRVLTDAQLEKFVLDPIMPWYKKAELTDEQMTKIKGELAKLAKGEESKDDLYGNNLMMKIQNFITKDVLTDEQKKKMGMK